MDLYISVISILFMMLVFYNLGMQAFRTDSQIHNISKPKFDKYMVWSIFFFAFMCGIRYRCGSDCESYVEGLKAVAKHVSSYDRDTEVEPLFLFYMRSCAALGIGRVLFLGGIAAVESYFLWAACKSRKYLLPFLGVVLVSSSYFLSFNNGLRQMIVACVFVYSISELIRTQNIIQYLVTMGICFFIHSSAILLLPVVFIYKYSVNINRWIAIVAFVVCFIVGRVSVLDDLLLQAEAGLSFLGYTGYADRMTHFVELESQIENFGPRSIVTWASFLIVFFWGNKTGEYYKQDKLYKISFLFTLVYSCASVLLASKSLLFMRPFEYLTPFVIISFSYLLWYLKVSRRPFSLCLVAMVICSYMFLVSVAERNVKDEAGLYKIVFLQENVR